VAGGRDSLGGGGDVGVIGCVIVLLRGERICIDESFSVFLLLVCEVLCRMSGGEEGVMQRHGIQRRGTWMNNRGCR